MILPHGRDPNLLRDDINALERTLYPRTGLSEKSHLLPFFRRHPNLAAFLGYANNYLVAPNLLGFEQALWDFRCDIVVGDSRNRQFTLVELEDARPESIFRSRRPPRAYPPWSGRFETGFSQLVDWAWRIAQERQPSHPLQSIFGTTEPKIHYLLLIGREHWLDDTGKARLEWRRRHNGIHGQSTTIWTYDDFLDLAQRRVAESPTSR